MSDGPDRNRAKRDPSGLVPVMARAVNPTKDLKTLAGAIPAS